MKLKLSDYDPKDVFRIIREWSDLDRKTFGQEIGKSEHTIKNYELGKSNYTLALLKKIAKKYGLEITIEKKTK